MKVKDFKIQLFFFMRINESFLLARSFLVTFFFGEQDPNLVPRAFPLEKPWERGWTRSTFLIGCSLASHETY